MGRFHVGDTVQIVPLSASEAPARARVLRLLPEDRSGAWYRVKREDETHERIVPENRLQRHVQVEMEILRHAG